MTGLQHTINMDGRDEFIQGNAQHGIHSQALHEQDSVSGTEGGVHQSWAGGGASQPCTVPVVMRVLIGLCLPL